MGTSVTSHRLEKTLARAGLSVAKTKNTTWNLGKTPEAVLLEVINREVKKLTEKRMSGLVQRVMTYEKSLRGEDS